MIKNEYDIHDDEFRIIGKPKNAVETPPKKALGGYKIVALIFCGAAVIGIIIWAIFALRPLPNIHYDVAPNEIEESIRDLNYMNAATDANILKSFTEYQRDTINDIPVDVFIPHNATVELAFGPLSLNDTSIVLIVSAADIRADTGYPVGAFVMKGEVIAKDLTKLGYCSIIDGQVNIGTSENSPLFEEAIKKNGYFFRQFPLVDNGIMVENDSRGKAIRKAICKRGNEVFVVMTANKESYHDFAQALADMQVENAVALMGSISFGAYRDENEDLKVIYPHLFKTKYENFLVWRKK